MRQVSLHLNIYPQSNKAYCPELGKLYDLESLAEFQIKSDLIGEDDVVASDDGAGIVNVNHPVIEKLLRLRNKMTAQLQAQILENGFVALKPFDKKSSNFSYNKGLWFKWEFEFLVEPRCFELSLPKVLLVSAVLTQVLSLASASISIYVKGVSIPVTLLLTSVSAMSTLMNFTQSGVTNLAEDVGHYLDHKPGKRCSSDFRQLKHKPMWFMLSLLIFAIWGTTLVQATISTVSETEIIDRAGFAAGLTFLTDDVITLHAICFALLGGITVGTFGGNFAIQTCKKMGNWLISKCAEPEDDDALEEEALLRTTH